MPAVRGYSDYLRSADGRPALLGLAGAVVTTLGSFGAGAIRVHDTTLEATHLSWMRFGHGLVLALVVVALAAAAYLWRAPIAAQVPAAAPGLAAYSDLVDDLREALAGAFSGG